MDTGQFRVFVSSRMAELAPERRIVEIELEKQDIEAWVFESDAGADSRSIQDVYLDEVAAADLYVGLFWKGYGEHTIQEYKHAQQLGKACLIYEKRVDIEHGRDQRLQQFLDRIGEITSGHTIGWFTDPEELAEDVKDDVQEWVEALHRQALDRFSTEQTADLQPLLELQRKVRQMWIVDLLDASLRRHERLDLGKVIVPEAVEHPLQRVERPPSEAEKLSGGASIARLFFEHGPTLLILGTPGSGKTVTLLRLARMLGNRVLKDAGRPIPVVFNLSSWSASACPALADWLVAEMRSLYFEPEAKSRSWLAERRLILLLDGLDEVADDDRAACIKAINAFLEDFDPPGLVVCSRVEEYEQAGARLRFRRGIRLEPLVWDEVEHMLERQGELLAALRRALTTDDDLRALAQSPLMLYVLSQTYWDVEGEVRAGRDLKAPGARRRQIFAEYIDVMFARKKPVFDEQHTRTWLAWLADRMQRHQQSLFLIERMQPSWLERPVDRWIYVLLSRLLGGGLLGALVGALVGVVLAAETQGGLWLGLNAGLVVGLLAGTVAGLWDGLRLPRPEAEKRTQGVFRHVMATLPLAGVVAAGVGSVLLLVDLRDLPFLLLMALPIGLFFGWKGRGKTLRGDIRTVERLHWSNAEARRGGGYGAVIGGGVGSLLGLFLGMTGPVMSAVEGLVVGMPGAVLGSLVGAFFGGLRGGQKETGKPLRNGLHVAGRNVGLGGAVVGLGGGMIVGLIVGVLGNAGAGLRWGLIAGMFFGVVAALWYGGLDLVQHAILRGLLLVRRRIPFRYRRFLDYAARLTLLKKAGGGYTFLHAYLQHYFADAEATLRSEEEPPKIVAEAVEGGMVVTGSD